MCPPDPPAHAPSGAPARASADAPGPDAARTDAFPGFRTGGRSVALPAQLFVDVLPAIANEAELRVTLYALYAIARVHGEPHAVRASALAAEAPLVRALATCGGAEAIPGALRAAARRGVLLECALEDGDACYFVHNDGGRRQRDRLLAGALDAPGGGRARPAEPAPAPSRPAAVYEAEIGLLTPSITTALREAEARYPATWIVDAIHEAVAHNARAWRYAEAILERWEAEGRDDEATGGAAGTATGRRRRPDPYGRVVRRSFE